MTLQTYCLRGNKVVDVPSLFLEFITLDLRTAVQWHASLIFFFYFVSQSGGSVTCSQVLLVRQVLNWDFMQYMAFEFHLLK